MCLLTRLLIHGNELANLGITKVTDNVTDTGINITNGGAHFHRYRDFQEPNADRIKPC